MACALPYCTGGGGGGGGGGAVTDLIPEPPVMGHLSTCVIITLSPDCNGLVCKQVWGFLRELCHLSSHQEDMIL